MALKHRKDIDGLRGIAIIPVILYHLNVPFFSGGYLGVDIFFVISGFLITSIIHDNIKEQNFSLLDFYERRLRRVIPILYFILILSIPLTLINFIEADSRNFFESLFAVITFSSNFLFWLEEGEYFTRENSLKPLLHTWSLSIEMQFYIIFPLIIIILDKIKKFKIIILSSICFLSFLIANWLSFTNPDAAFYLSLTRIWELLLGSLCALLRISRKKLKSKSEYLCYISLIIIFLSVISFNDKTLHPSFFSLLPVLATCFLILYSEESKSFKKILQFGPLSLVGLISYSLYILHFPMIAFLGYIDVNLSNQVIFIFLFFLFLTSYFSWVYIETPFRKKKKVSKKIFFNLYFSLSIILAAVGLSGHFLIKDKTDDFVNNQFDSPRYSIKNSIMILGDSHASHYVWGLEQYFGKDKVDDLSSNGCIPFLDFDRVDSRFKEGVCPREMNLALEKFAEERKYEILIMSNMGPVYLDGTTFKNKGEARIKGLKLTLKNFDGVDDNWKLFEIGMRNTFNFLSTLGVNKKVFYVIDIPELGLTERQCDVNGKKVNFKNFSLVLKKPNFKNCFVKEKEYLSRSKRFNDLVNKIGDDYPKIKIINTSNFLCKNKICKGIENNQKLYRDADHLSKFGSLYLSKFISEEIIKHIKIKDNLPILNISDD